MDLDFTEITYLKDPVQSELQADFVQFLLSLTGPTVIDITGKNPNKSRVISTLLHGNEPSGLIAMHRWLTQDGQIPIPEVNLRFIICSVEAASTGTLFSHRFLTHGKDLNRCFGSQESTGYFHRAKLIEQAIQSINPEVVIDLHNTSGAGPAFGVCPQINPLGLTIASFFCDTVILSSLKLGALMEQDFGCLAITIECGGKNDEQAHEVAFIGINRLSECSSLEDYHQTLPVEIVYKPLRLQLKPSIELSYSEHDEGYEGVTLKSNIEQFNYGSAHKGQMLGWLDERGLDNLVLLDESKENVVKEFFNERDNQLVCAKNLRIFMATTDKDIAIGDCLFYIVNQPNGKL